MVALLSWGLRWMEKPETQRVVRPWSLLGEPQDGPDHPPGLDEASGGAQMGLFLAMQA